MITKIRFPSSLMLNFILPPQSFYRKSCCRFCQQPQQELNQQESGSADDGMSRRNVKNRQQPEANRFQHRQSRKASSHTTAHSGACNQPAIVLNTVTSDISTGGSLRK